jgi:hypothetical protein
MRAGTSQLPEQRWNCLSEPNCNWGEITPINYRVNSPDRVDECPDDVSQP